MHPVIYYLKKSLVRCMKANITGQILFSDNMSFDTLSFYYHFFFSKEDYNISFKNQIYCDTYNKLHNNETLEYLIFQSSFEVLVHASSLFF